DKTVIGAFAGLTGLAYQVPFFSTLYQTRYPGVGVYFKERLGRWQISSLEVFSRKRPAIQSARYDGQKIQFYANGGIVQNKWQASGTFFFQPSKHINVLATDIHQLNLRGDTIAAFVSKGGFTGHGSRSRGTYLNRE